MTKIKSKRKSKAKNASFEAESKRFNYMGVHPNLIAEGRCPLGPGQYDPKPMGCVHQMVKSPWDREQESEAFSQYLGYRNKAILEERAFRQSVGGPGSYEIPYGPLDQGVTFGKEKRFKTSKKNHPAPGTHTIKSPKTKFGKVPEFEWDGIAPRFKDTEPTFRKAPNRYNVKAPPFAKKTVTKRGPYDCFTGPRDATTIKNHFGPPNFKPPDKHYNINSNLDVLLHHPTKRRCGKFLKAERFPKGMRIKVTRGLSMYEKDQDFPGPAAYNIAGGDAGTAPLETKRKPFNTSKKHARPPADWKIHPGPERYRVKPIKCMHQNPQPSWMFTSKTKRS